MKFLTRNRIAGLTIAAIVFIADQLVKRWVVADLGLRQRGDQVVVAPFFNLTRENNYGVSLGMFAADSMEMRWALVALTGGIALFVLVWMMREKAMADIMALALILGGAVGNVVDRLLHGYVVDFLDFHWSFLFGMLHGGHFSVFNIVDAGISVGAVCLILDELLRVRKT